MEFVSNNKKNVKILVGEDIYLRHAIKTRFITSKDNYIDILKEYVSEIYEKGDIISISEKIISICQNRIVRREDIKIGICAKFLSKFACRKNRGGYGVGMEINMQYAINKVGILRVILASIASRNYKIIWNKGGILQNCWTRSKWLRRIL